MNINSVNICLNCSNLSNDFECLLHNTKVDINNSCDSHNQFERLNKDSSCLNCSSFETTDCNFSNRSGEGMLCFDWKK